MVKCSVNFLGFCLVVLLILPESSGYNNTERNSSDSFVVSANYGVQTEHIKPSHELENSGFVPNYFKQNDEFTESSLYNNNQQTDYRVSHEPNTEEYFKWPLQNTQYDSNRNNNDLQTYSRNSEWTPQETDEILPTPRAWQGRFVSDHISNYEAESRNNINEYYPDSSAYYTDQRFSESTINPNVGNRAYSSNINDNYNQYQQLVSPNDHNSGYQENLQEKPNDQYIYSSHQEQLDSTTHSYLGHQVSPEENQAAYSHNSAYSNIQQPLDDSTSKQKNTENYLKSILHKNDAIGTLKGSSYSLHSTNLDYTTQNSQANDQQNSNTNGADPINGSQNHNNSEYSISRSIGEITNDKAFETHSGYQVKEHLNERSKPNMREIQEILSKIIRGSSKVHQVIKVPAVYEIHLQEEGKHVKEQDQYSFQVPLPESTQNGQTWKQYNQIHSPIPGISRPYNPKWTGTGQQQSRLRNEPWKKNQYSKGSQHSMRVWNLPSKIKYFENHSGLYNKKSASSNGQYSYSKPTWSSEWPNNKNTHNFDKIIPTGPPIYGSVSVPITPGTAEVILSDHGSYDHQNNYYNGEKSLQTAEAMPDLTHYYAAKKEVEREGFLKSNKNPTNTFYSNVRSDKDNLPNVGSHYATPKQMENSNGYQQYHNPNSYKRVWGKNGRPNSKENYLRRKDVSSIFPFSNLNYIIHVREKSRY